MRFTFIKETSDEKRLHFAKQAIEMGAGKMTGYKNYGGTDLKQFSPPAPPATIQHQNLASSNAHRFNYKDYMKNLHERLHIGAPNSGHLSGSTFQEFICKERQGFVKSVNHFGPSGY
jgi:hypothetical protein